MCIRDRPCNSPNPQTPACPQETFVVPPIPQHSTQSTPSKTITTTRPGTSRRAAPPATPRSRPPPPTPAHARHDRAGCGAARWCGGYSRRSGAPEGRERRSGSDRSAGCAQGACPPHHRAAPHPKRKPRTRKGRPSFPGRPHARESICEVPASNVLGPVGQGYKIAIETLNEGRIGIGAQMIGVAGGALAAATAYVKERTQFGKALAEFQGIQFQLAQARTELEAARLMVYNAARLKDMGKDIAMEGAMAKLFSSQVAERVTSISLELFGGYGYTKDYPAEKFYRDAKIGAIYEGTSNMQLQTIAKVMLK